MKATGIDKIDVVLTVVTCNYNHGCYLPEAVQSVLNQKFEGIEYIIIDDGSTDASREIILQCASQYAWIRPIFHEKNLGVTASINEGLRLARGKYIHYLSADDILLGDFFKKSMEKLSQYPEAGLSASKSCFFHDSLSKIEPTEPIRFVTHSQYVAPAELIQVYRETNFWISGATIFRTDFAREYGGFLPSMEPMNDWFLFIQIALNHGIVYVPEMFYANRINRNSFSRILLSKRRSKCFSALLNTVNRLNRDFRNAFRKAALLSFHGKHIILFLLLRPQFWFYLPSIVAKKIRQKLDRYALRKSKVYE